MSDILPHTMAPHAAEPGGCVTVLLATFNGAKFLRRQLSSLLDQHDVSWRLLWRDDGSSDTSVAIMEAFAEEAPGRVSCAQQECATRLGAARSYYTLARQAPDGGCVAFCDQDDVWLPHKLARGFAALQAVPAAIPALYCARQRLVDAALRPLGTSMHLRQHPEFAMALTQNIATGCTVMLNAAAADLLRAAPPPPATLHDWWSYLLVTGVDGRLILDDEPVVLYRQHGGNLVGAPHSAWRRAAAALRRGPGAFMRVFRAHLRGLSEQQELLSPAAQRATRDISAALRCGPLQRARVLLRYRLRRQNRLETALFCVWFLVG